MTSKERIIKTVLHEKTDRTPFIFPFDPWPETLELWHKQGLSTNSCYTVNTGCDKGFMAIPAESLRLGFCPPFKEKIISENNGKRIFQDQLGIIQEIKLGNVSIPNYLEYPVKSPDDWNRLKYERLQPAFEERFLINPENLKKWAKEHNGITQIGNFPYGLFGTARDLIGVEDLLIWFYDYPETVADIMNTLTDLWILIYKEVSKHIQIDCVHIWEDMSGKQGPLISPQMMREFMVPNYKKIRQFCDEYNVPVFSLDTDGDCDLLFEPLIEGGINLIYPFEVAAGSDVVEIKKRYPAKFCVMGGIDKRKIAMSEYDIDKEIERIMPAIEMGGYIPALDHLIHPEISYSNFLYFSKKLKTACGEGGE